MTKALARRFKFDVSVDGTTWVRLHNVNDFAPTENDTTQATDDYDNGGFNGYEKTMTGWQVVAKFTRDTTANVPSDAGQSLLEATRYQFGDACRTYIRWYDRNGSTTGNWSGRAIVKWNQSKTGVADIEEVTVTLMGDGVLSAISNPNTNSAAPVVTLATPSGVAAGGQVSIYGTSFDSVVATTGVKFGGVNATSWVPVSGSLIVAIMPTGTAGSAPITVTNGVGASNALAYTRS